MAKLGRRLCLAVGADCLADGFTCNALPVAPSGPVAQWLEPAAHNGLVAGSSPARPTTFSYFIDFIAIFVSFLSMRWGLKLRGRISLVTRLWEHEAHGVASEPLPIGRTGVGDGELRVFQSENRHQLSLGCAILCGHSHASLAHTVRRAMRQAVIRRAILTLLGQFSAEIDSVISLCGLLGVLILIMIV